MTRITDFSKGHISYFSITCGYERCNHLSIQSASIGRSSISLSPVNRTCNNSQSVFVVLSGSDGRTFLLSFLPLDGDSFWSGIWLLGPARLSTPCVVVERPDHPLRPIHFVVLPLDGYSFWDGTALPIDADLVNDNTQYEVISYFWLDVMARNQILQCKHRLCVTNLPNMTPLAISGRLQNVTEHCTKVHKLGPACIASNAISVSRGITIKNVCNDFLVRWRAFHQLMAFLLRIMTII